MTTGRCPRASCCALRIGPHVRPGQRHGHDPPRYCSRRREQPGRMTQDPSASAVWPFEYPETRCPILPSLGDPDPQSRRFFCSGSRSEPERAFVFLAQILNGTAAPSSPASVTQRVSSASPDRARYRRKTTCTAPSGTIRQHELIARRRLSNGPFTVAVRLGHSGWRISHAFRVNAAWLPRPDQRATEVSFGAVPARPRCPGYLVPACRRPNHRAPRERCAVELRDLILRRRVPTGSLPTWGPNSSPHPNAIAPPAPSRQATRSA